MFTTRVLTAFGSVALLTTVGLWSAPLLVAAVKAALVQNIDEPGRSPYQESKLPDCGVAVTCEFQFSDVPAGKRLVVTHVSGTMSIYSGSPYKRANLTFLSHNTPLTLQQFEQELPLVSRGESIGVEQVITNETVLAYFEAGQAPYVEIASDSKIEGTVKFALSGYYINLP